MRILIAGIESGDHDTHAYPFAKFFTKKEIQESNTSMIVTYFYIALRFAHGIGSVDVADSCSEFVYSVNTWEGRKSGMDLKIDHVLQPDLPSFVMDSISKTSCSDDEFRSQAPCTSMATTSTTNVQHNKVDCRFNFREIDSTDDCLASPMKKTKIGKT